MALYAKKEFLKEMKRHARADGFKQDAIMLMSARRDAVLITAEFAVLKALRTHVNQEEECGAMMLHAILMNAKKIAVSWEKMQCIQLKENAKFYLKTEV